MLRTNKSHNTVAISQTCLPEAAGENVGLRAIAGMNEQITEIVNKPITLGVSSRGTGEKRPEKKPTKLIIGKDVGFFYCPYIPEGISEDIGLNPEEFLSKRYAMERYLGTIDDKKEKDTLTSNYDRAMKFIV